MKRLHFSISLLIALLALSGCRKGDLQEIKGNEERIIKVLVEMPEEPALRAEAGENTEGNKLLLRWRRGEELTLLFKQEDVLSELIKTTLENISSDNKSATFEVKLPNTIDAEKPYTLYAFSSFPGEGISVKDGRIMMDITPIVGMKLEDVSVPVMSVVSLSDGKQEVRAMFSVFGTIEYIPLRNGSDKALNISSCHLAGVGGAEWRYMPMGDRYYHYDLFENKVVESDGAKSIITPKKVTNIAPGEEGLFASWFYPLEKSLPVMLLRVKSTDSEEVIYSENSKPAKAIGMEPGKAYRVRAEWTGRSLQMKGRDVIPTDTPFITMVTAKETGQTIRLLLAAKEENKSKIWIDLNGNGLLDEGENDIVWADFDDEFNNDEYKEYRFSSSKITIYGPVTALECSGNKLKELVVNGRESLEMLSFYENNLSTLDLSLCKRLKYLDCEDNAISSLDISRCKELNVLWCSNNGIKALDVSECKDLRVLGCSKNELEELNIVENKRLQNLSCHGNKLSSLDVKGYSSLERIRCDGNKLSSLDLEGCTALRKLYCFENSISFLNIKDCKALNNLWCNKNMLSSLDLSVCLSLEELYCGDNSLTELDASNHESLRLLECHNNLLTSLKVEKCVALRELYCDDNKLSVLDVRDCKALSRFWCQSNELETLDVSSCPNIADLPCQNNKLKSLKLSRDPSSQLSYLTMQENKMDASALNAVYEALPNREGKEMGIIEAVDNDGYATSDVSIATAKNWKFQPYVAGSSTPIRRKELK